MFLSEIPGYTRAGKRGDRLQDYWRDYAFLGLPEEIRIPGRNSVQVRQLTLRMFVQLCAVRSPFLVGGEVGVEHVAQILWRLSPKYDTREQNPDARKNLVAEIAQFPFKSTVRAIDRYLNRMLIDKPPSAARGTDAMPDTSFAASIIHYLAGSYGWSDEVILDCPMPRIFQYMRKIRRENDPDLPYFNPLRDKFTSRITAKFLNQNNEQ